MTAKDADFLQEARRVRRRNLKRYWYTQSYRRIAGYRTLVDEREPNVTAARAVLVLVLLAVCAAGVWSVLF